MGDYEVYNEVLKYEIELQSQTDLESKPYTVFLITMRPGLKLISHSNLSLLILKMEIFKWYVKWNYSTCVNER